MKNFTIKIKNGGFGAIVASIYVGRRKIAETYGLTGEEAHEKAQNWIRNHVRTHADPQAA